MSKYRIKMNDKIYELEIELIEEGISNREMPDYRRETHSSEKITQRAVRSPMPGNVIEITRKQGQKVAKGETVLILETMKMENEISAPEDGTIKEFFVREGQSVSADAPLFELEG